MKKIDWTKQKCESSCCATPTNTVTKCCDCPNCTAVTLKYAVCQACKLENRFHPRHHGQDFCRAERDMQGKKAGFETAPQDGKMYIKIKENAADLVDRRSSFDFSSMMLRVEGRWLEVETQWLFSDQFNTAPIEDVSDSGLRVMQEWVDDIVGDIRTTRKRCNWCGHHSDEMNIICYNCERTDYFKALIKLPKKCKTGFHKCRLCSTKKYAGQWYCGKRECGRNFSLLCSKHYEANLYQSAD